MNTLRLIADVIDLVVFGTLGLIRSYWMYSIPLIVGYFLFFHK